MAKRPKPPLARPPQYRVEPLPEPPLTPVEKAGVLMTMFTHIDTLQWRMPAYSVSAAVVILGAGAWLLNNIENVAPPLFGARAAIFAFLAMLSGIVVLVGVNNIRNTRKHAFFMCEEMRRLTDIDYFWYLQTDTYPRVSASWLAMIVLGIIAFLLFAGGAVLFPWGDIAAWLAERTAPLWPD